MIKYKILKKTMVQCPKISIIIRCKNEEKKLEQCLQMIEKQNIEESYEIIIIDSGSTDNTLTIALMHDVSIYTIDSIDFNFGTSVNLGVFLSRGEFCVFLSAHVIPVDCLWLYKLLKPFKVDNVAAAYSKQLYYEDTFLTEKRTLSDTFGNVSREQKILNGATSFRQIKKEITFSNASSCLKKDVALEIPFRKLSASEDREWALRVLKAGYSIYYISESQVYHAHNETYEQYYKRIYINAKALYEFMGVKINWYHFLPIIFLQVYRDMRFLYKEHIKFSLQKLYMSFKYAYYYTLAHYKATRE